MKLLLLVLLLGLHGVKSSEQVVGDLVQEVVVVKHGFNHNRVVEGPRHLHRLVASLYRRAG